MNDQLKNLYQQALYEANRIYASMEVEPEEEFDVWFYGIVNEKFSELIVLRCVDVINAAKPGVNQIPAEVALDIAAKNVKSYFGVEYHGI